MNKNDKNSFESYEKRIEKEFENSTIFNDNVKIDVEKHKHKKNSGYVKLLCAMLCFLIVIGASIFSIVKFWPVEEEKQETTEETKSISLTSSANVDLSDMKNVSKKAVSNVSEIHIKNETDEFVCVPYKVTQTDDDGEKTESVYFKLKDVDKNIPIDDSLVTDFYDQIFSVSALSKLEGEWTEKDCGLDNPKIYIKVTMADKSQFTVKVGNKLATSDGYYYVSTSLKDGIFICEGSVYDNFSTTLSELVNTTLFSALTKDDVGSKYFQNDKLTVFDSIEINGDNFNDVKLSYHNTSDDIMQYFIDKPVYTYASDEKLEALLSPLSEGLTASFAYKINPTDADVKKYGLDKPYMSINYKFGNKTYNIKFSKPGCVDANYSACTVNDTPVIYGVLDSQIEFIDWKLNDLRFNLLYLRDIETFKTLTAKYNGKAYKYELSFDTVVSDDETTGTSSTTSAEKELSVVLNSSPIDADNFKTAYQRITMASATKYLDSGESVKGNPELTFEIELQNGKTDVITYTKYNENYYLHKLNGVGDELIPKRTVDALILNFEKLRKGEEVISPNNQQ
ncbi:MAG: DUF4340 domain-containing protein [Acutalibacteraceae bacterium]